MLFGLFQAIQALLLFLSSTGPADTGHQAAELILLAASSSAALAQNDLPTAKMTAEEGAWPASEPCNVFCIHPDRSPGAGDRP